MKHALVTLMISSVFVAGLPFAMNAQSQRKAEHARTEVASDQLKGTVAVADRLATSGSTSVVIELNDAPVAVVGTQSAQNGATTSAVSAVERSQADQIDRAQDQVSARLSQLNVAELFRTRVVYNGIAARVDAAQIPAIRAIPGVKAIHKLITHERDNASSVPLIGAPSLWQQTGLGLTGQGLRVGVIDTGIDYTHRNFGGNGDFATKDGTDTVLTDGGFPTTKVVGGFDFAGDTYTGRNAPQPDPDPLDCASAQGGGHGSHVAGTVAGYGVNADGSTYTGIYGTDTTFDQLKIGPGVAPEADLYAIRVFGCIGGTNLTIRGFEYAVDPNGDGDTSDHLDVVNLSLGSSFGVEYDSTSVAADNAAAAGVIVVISAGNLGDTYYISGSPGSANAAITVASSVDSTSIVDAFNVTAPPAIAGLKPASRSAAYNWSNPAVTANVYYPATNQSGCAAFSTAEKAKITSKILLVDWRAPGEATFPCGSVARANNAASAGAVGIIMVDNTVSFESAINGNALIPAVYTNSTTGNQLKSQLVAGTPSSVTATFSGAYNNTGKLVLPEFVDTLSSFSSRGPRRGGVLKPDISAPGQSIFSTDAGTNTEGETLNGTSMAAPHVAGAMALLREFHPDWSVQELKALVMNTARTNVRSAADPASQRYGPARAGAGRITLPAAVAEQVIVYDTASPLNVSSSFGNLEVSEDMKMSRSVTIKNKGNAEKIYNLNYDAVTTVPGVSYSVSPATVTLAAGQVAQATVTISVDFETLAPATDPTVATTQNDYPRHVLSEASGYLALSEDTTLALRNPVYASVRRASTMKAASAVLPFAKVSDSATGDIALQGIGFDDDRSASLVTALELQGLSSRAIIPNPISDSGDIQYVGVGSDYASTSPNAGDPGVIANTTMYFGVATYDTWTTPSTVEFDIYVDTNKDGTEDYVFYNYNYAQAVGGGSANASDTFVTVVCKLSPAVSCSVDSYINELPATTDTALFNSRVMVLPVAAKDIGLTDASSSFNYSVFSFTNEVNSYVDQVRGLSYNPAAPGLDASGEYEGIPTWVDTNDSSIPVVYNKANYDANGSKGLLLLHHNNRRDLHAEIVRFVEDVPPTATPTATSTATPTATATATVTPTATATPGDTTNIYLPLVGR